MRQEDESEGIEVAWGKHSLIPYNFVGNNFVS
jgi:hypothetical protein